jgi:hypothetical protein
MSLYGSSVRETWRGGSFARGPEGYERRLWGQESLFMGAQLGNQEWDNLPGSLRYGRKGLWMWCVSLCGSSVKGTWREGSLAGNPEGYLEKALEMGISFHRGSVWGTWRRAPVPGSLRAG